jgi:polynucleotide 5'-hydroxyl-kinase GRC3/NOL9
LLAKIREVDELMTPGLQSRVREIHPEISFWALNGNRPVPQNKKTAPGRAQRRELLQTVFADVDSILAKTPTGGYAIDDALDALVAAWTAAQTIVGKAETLPDSPACDKKGLRMEILCPLAQDSVSEDWASEIAAQIIRRDMIKKGVCLVLGGSDTGKTTLAAALARHAASSRSVASDDDDIGQSHIGPPTTVGWGTLDNPTVDLSDLTVKGISFVGHVTPVGHLLQLTTAITQCVQQARKAAELVIIDTPGLISGPGAAALWWTMQRMLQPELIVAVQRNDELRDILAGLKFLAGKIELIECPPQIALKSPERRRKYRRSQFAGYFENSCLYDINLSDVGVQPGRSFRPETLTNRVVGLRNAEGVDLAIGLIEDWQADGDIAVIRAPQLDIEQIRCLVIGDVTIDIAGENP